MIWVGYALLPHTLDHTCGNYTFRMIQTPMALNDAGPLSETLILDDVRAHMMHLYVMNCDVLMSEIAYANRPHTHARKYARVRVMVTFLGPKRPSIEDTHVYHVLEIYFDKITNGGQNKNISN